MITPRERIPNVMWDVFSDKAPKPGNYSQAVVTKVGSIYLVDFAGQTGNVPDGQDDPLVLVPGQTKPGTSHADYSLQSQQALRNIGGILDDLIGRGLTLRVGSGSLLTHVQVDMVDMTAEHKKAFEDAYSSFFMGNSRYPARTFREVPGLPLPGEGCLVELTARAAIPEEFFGFSKF
ncbi:MAG: RidA family protein [Candidatus Pacearchaeota archaeon]|jgi:enamine deaminase RidA (YjgF/YER057c/UK114 family)